MDPLRREHPGKLFEVWFQDEARFGKKGMTTVVWAKRGSRPRVVRQTEYDWVYLYGACCPASGESVGMVAGSVGIEWMNIHLRWISEHVLSTPGGEHVQVVLILDKAGWHTSPKLKVPSNITLLHLPSYSPELNPMEVLWQWLKSHCLSNHVYEDLDHLYRAGAEAWNSLKPARIKSVCHAEYMERAN